jgi:predicted amidohydrolase
LHVTLLLARGRSHSPLATATGSWGAPVAAVTKIGPKPSFNEIGKASQNGVDIRGVRSSDFLIITRKDGRCSAMKTVRIAAAQTVEFREDIEAALNCVADVASRARAEGASLLCFPECFLQGYLTDEIPARRNALDLASPVFRALLSRLPKTEPMTVMGLIEMEKGRLFNTAIVVDHGALIGRHRKVHLLGGERIFTPGSDSNVFEVSGLRFGINICYETNFPEAARKVADLGASLIVCPANNMHHRKTAEALKNVHHSVRAERCRETGLWLVSADVTGEHAGRISWGPTAVLNPDGEVVAQLPLEQTGLLVFDIPCRL